MRGLTLAVSKELVEEPAVGLARQAEAVGPPSLVLSAEIWSR